MPSRTSNRGRTTVWIPGLLLLLVALALWVLVPGPTPPQPTLADAPLTLPSLNPGGETPHSATLDLDSPSAQSRRTKVPVIPHFGSVGGRVVAEDWVLWPAGIVLTLTPQSGGPALQTLGVSQEQPRFRFEKVPLDHYRLSLEAPDCVKQSLLITVSAAQSDQFFAVPLTPAASIVGRVMDSSGRPVAHIPVAATFYSTAPGRNQVPQTATTDNEGKFRISGLRDGEFEVYVGTFRNPLSDVQIIGISREAPEAWVSFTVEAMGSATITVNFLDGLEAASADWRTMRIQAIRQGTGKGFSESLALREDGKVFFPALPSGDYSFKAYGGPYRHVARQASVGPSLPTLVTIPMRRMTKGPQR